MRAEGKRQIAEAKTADPTVIAKERSDCGNLPLPFIRHSTFGIRNRPDRRIEPSAHISPLVSPAFCSGLTPERFELVYGRATPWFLKEPH